MSIVFYYLFTPVCQNLISLNVVSLMILPGLIKLHRVDLSDYILNHQAVGHYLAPGQTARLDFKTLFYLLLEFVIE